MTGHSETLKLPLHQIDSAATALAVDAEAMGKALSSIKEHLGAALPHWAGPSAGTAARRVAAEYRLGRGLIATANRQVEILRRARKELEAEQTRLQEVAAEALAKGFAVNDAGVVTDRDRQGQAHDHQAQDYTAALQSTLRRIAKVDRRAAAELDENTARLGQRRRSAINSPGRRSLPALPADGGDPAQNRLFWAELSDRERALLIRTQPAVVGELEGLPAQARHEANISRLDPEIQRWTEIRAQLQVRVQASRVPALDRNRIRLWQAQRKIDDATTLKRMVHEIDAARLRSMNLHSGARGMAAVSLGDTDTADHIALTVPGVNTNIADSFWWMAEESRRLVSLAEDLLDRAGRHGETVAAVIWLDFEPPQVTGPNGALDTITGGVASSTTGAARAGAPRLAGAFAGLKATSRHPSPHLTALGHSYGSYTTALALQWPARQDPPREQPVDDAVFYGSPGINAAEAKDLGLPDGHGFVMLGDRDRINLVDGLKIFGPDPMSTNLVQLSTAATTTRDGIERHAARDHADYGRRVDEHLRVSGFNMAAIVAGLSNWAIRR